MQIIINIPAAKTADFLAGFLEVIPKPEEAISDENWVLNRVKLYLKQHYKAGKHLIARKAAVVDEDLL